MKTSFVLLSLSALFLACGSPKDAQDCVDKGGACVAVSSCAKGTGFLGTEDCGSVPVVCCYDRCGGQTEDFQCCTQDATFRPTCENGQLVCAAGQTRC